MKVVSLASPSAGAPAGEILSLAEHRVARCAMEIVSRRLRIGVRDLRAPTRCRAPIARARQLVAYLCCVGAGLTQTATGRALGRDRTTIAHACRLIEDMRDDPRRPGFERAMRAMEAELQRALASPSQAAPSTAARA